MNLSKKSIEITISRNLNTRVNLETLLIAKSEDLKYCYIETHPDWQYYFFEWQPHKRIVLNKNSHVELLKIEQGYLKNNFCLVERNKKTNVYVLHEDGILTFPELKANIQTKDLDLFFDNEILERLTAKILTKFNLNHSMQNYELFCENLPKNCLGDNNFVENVKKKLLQMPIEVINVHDMKMVNCEYCKNKALNYFEKETRPFLKKSEEMIKS